MSTPETKSSNSRSEINIILFDNNISLNDCVLVGGYFGLGRVGYLSINHLLENLEFKKIGYIKSDFLPPFVSVKNNSLQAPFEIYKYQNIVLIASHFEPYKYEQRSYAEALVKFAMNHKLKSIIQIGGLDARYQSEPEQELSLVLSHNVDPTTVSNYKVMDEGLYVTGIAALTMLYSEYSNFPCMLVLPFAQRARPDPKASSVAIRLLNDLYGIDCPIDALVDEGRALEIEEQNVKEIAEKQALINNNDSSDMFA